MHGKILTYLEPYKDLCEGKQVLEVGSLNVNGNAREVLNVTVGTDMREGKGVDLVCKGEDLLKHFKPESFDVVVSTDTLEHVRDWREFLQGIWQVLKTDGLFICTIASVSKGRHAYPDDYWRLTEEHVIRIFKGNEIIDTGTPLGVSFGFVVRKKAPLWKLEDLHLLPVDGKVPQELLPNGQPS